MAMGGGGSGDGGGGATVEAEFSHYITRDSEGTHSKYISVAGIISEHIQEKAAGFELYITGITYIKHEEAAMRLRHETH